MAEINKVEKSMSPESGEQKKGTYAGVDMREIYEKKPMSYKVIKRLFDILGSAAAMVILLPVFLVTAIAVKACDGGPAFYSGMRYGKDMKYFRMHKFRSMCENAESMTEDYLRASDINGLAFKIKNDPRVTKVGHFIRKTSIDELPQLWNVLKGEMSLVGPRPIQVIGREISEYERQRWIVKPGITCIWQVSRRNYVPWDEWVDMDLEYIQKMSVFTDIKILGATIDTVIRRIRDADR